MGDQLSVKVRLVQLTISGDKGKPPLMEVSLYYKNNLVSCQRIQKDEAPLTDTDGMK